MYELSSVLRDVLRALGVDAWERAGLARGDAPPDVGDLHGRMQPEEFTRG
ncbi:MAG TPA: hypothetical protein VF092_16150 [Longimicrobium sp.]